MGGAADDWANDTALDSSEGPVIVGSTASSGFPVTPGAIDATWNGMLDAFMARIDGAGTSVTYASFHGGADDDQAQDVTCYEAVRTRVYMTGWTSSSGFPTTTGAYDPTANGGLDAFLSKIVFR